MALSSGRVQLWKKKKKKRKRIKVGIIDLTATPQVKMLARQIYNWEDPFRE